MSDPRAQVVKDIAAYIMGASAEAAIGVRGDGWLDDAAAEAAQQWLSDWTPPLADGPDGIEVARITIIRTVTEDDVIDNVHAHDSHGDDLPLTEALGMLRLAEDTLLHPPEEDEDD